MAVKFGNIQPPPNAPPLPVISWDSWFGSLPNLVGYWSADEPFMQFDGEGNIVRWNPVVGSAYMTPYGSASKPRLGYAPGAVFSSVHSDGTYTDANLDTLEVQNAGLKGSDPITISMLVKGAPIPDPEANNPKFWSLSASGVQERWAYASTNGITPIRHYSGLGRTPNGHFTNTTMDTYKWNLLTFRSDRNAFSTTINETTEVVQTDQGAESTAAASLRILGRNLQGSIGFPGWLNHVVVTRSWLNGSAVSTMYQFVRDTYGSEFIGS